jgi:two-component system, LytTR family, sensor kinase
MKTTDISQSRKSKESTFFYIAYWTGYLLFFTFQRLFAMREALHKYAIDEKIADFKISFITNLIYLPAVIAASHFVVNYLLPKFYFRNKFYLFSTLAAITVILYPVLAYLIRMLVVDPLYPNPEAYSINNYFSAMLIFVFGMAPLAWYSIAGHLREEESLRQRIDKDRLEALLKLKETELKLLKSQIQPHFLFNTLNNLYSLALEKSDRTPDMIIRLSDMLNYIIYDCKSERVPLSKEIDFIRNYIELQKVRYETCSISFSVRGGSSDKQIAPMILHTFIDNSFKHGADKDPDKPWIRISITATDGTLFLSVVNSKRNNGEQRNNSTGIGIANTQKRLDLIYRDRHELVFHDSDSRYAVFLKMQL